MADRGGLTVALNTQAQALAARGDMRVTFLAVTRRYQQCQEGVQAQVTAASAIQYKCLAPEHFVPGVRSRSRWHANTYLATVAGFAAAS